MSLILFSKNIKNKGIYSSNQKEKNNKKEKLHLFEDESISNNHLQLMIDNAFYDDFLKSLNESKDKFNNNIKDKSTLKTKKEDMIKYDVDEQFKNFQKIEPKKKFRRSISATNCGQNGPHFNIFQLQYSKNIHSRKKYKDENKSKNSSIKETKENKIEEIPIPISSPIHNPVPNSNQTKDENILNEDYKIKNKKKFFFCFSCL